MLGLFKETHHHPNQLPADIEESLPSFIDQTFARLHGLERLTPESRQQKKAALQEILLSALNNIQEEIVLDNIRQKLLSGEYDMHIFKAPQQTKEILLLIQKDNRFFMQHLFAFCDQKDTLNFWLGVGGAKLPEDSIAQAIRLRSRVCVFGVLLEAGCFRQVSEFDKQQLIKHGQIYLKDHPDSLSLLNEVLNEGGSNDINQHKQL